MTTRVYLVRHGATELSSEDRFAGAIDVLLSDEGREQARMLGKRLETEPISVAFCNALEAGNLMRFYAEAVDKVMGDVYTSDTKSFVAQRRVPRGVVAAVVPWNFPTFNALLKVAPALAAGNSVVLKPSELSSRSAIRTRSASDAAAIFCITFLL